MQIPKKKFGLIFRNVQSSCYKIKMGCRSTRFIGSPFNGQVTGKITGVG